ncbi:MAG: hypothetical protein WC179_00040 [Candidatus Cloacimonadaceae bacterium]|jgi:PAS domain-containing protein|nr:hypothetical protein [Candidatus Cloacimonadota bacterium]MCB5258136.1 hypothetical protein [Candidatus Cloacimonadota bacterium]MDD5624525.1 hypothetical protein [Candidatus Cloacimonadota bacterium]MDY0112305.1 hypothetical protein [Candidatus Syntrophosphaera sp.]
MKRSLSSLYRLIIAVILILILLETTIVILIATNAQDLTTLVNDIQTAVIVFALIIFIYCMVVYNLIPSNIKKFNKNVVKLINEIAHGKYNVDIDKAIEDYSFDPDKLALLNSLKNMLRSINGFDQAKEWKIYEQDQRIKQLINLIPQGVLIALSNGDISYYNNSLRQRYPSLSEIQNINDMSFKSDFDRKIFQKIVDALRYGDNIYECKIPDQDYKRLAIIKGSMVRNLRGEPTGGVFLLSFEEHV